MQDTQLQRAIQAFPLDDDHPWFVVVDLELIASRLAELQRAFPASWAHAIAVKAHPLVRTLARLVDAGAGLEAASMAEVDVALLARCPAANIVFDSPVKTRAELARAVELGVLINADNLDEVARLAELKPAGRVGLRLNPEVAFGRVEALSVGVRNSKFGVSLTAELDGVRRAFAQHDWLDGVHVHVGSFGYHIDLLAAGIRRTVDIATEVGARRVDIGGGMPPGASAADYRAVLEVAVPELFDGRFDVVTEFGRWLFWDTAVAVSKVEYVKPAADGAIATIHFGADLLLRRIYLPDVWSTPIHVHAPDGSRRTDDVGSVTIGGPLCFGGDVLIRDAQLPMPREGDLVVVSQVGAYTFGMWSRYCSRRFPRIVGLDPGPALLHAGESDDDVASHW